MCSSEVTTAKSRSRHTSTGNLVSVCRVPIVRGQSRTFTARARAREVNYRVFEKVSHQSPQPPPIEPSKSCAPKTGVHIRDEYRLESWIPRHTRLACNSTLTCAAAGVPALQHALQKREVNRCSPLSTSPLCQTHASRYMLFFQAHITHMDMDMDMDMNTDMDMDMDMDMGLWPSGTFPSYI